jgi:hypothetical protein
MKTKKRKDIEIKGIVSLLAYLDNLNPEFWSKTEREFMKLLVTRAYDYGKEDK